MGRQSALMRSIQLLIDHALHKPIIIGLPQQSRVDESIGFFCIFSVCAFYLPMYTLQKKKRKTTFKKRNTKPHSKKETQNHILVTLGR